jgi:hypothetical protein
MRGGETRGDGEERGAGLRRHASPGPSAARRRGAGGGGARYLAALGLTTAQRK